MTDALVVRHDGLKAFALAVLDRWGTPPNIAELTQDLMVRTDLRALAADLGLAFTLGPDP